MPDPVPHRSFARALALVASFGLAGLVVVNAQFGCDSPASNPPPKLEPEPTAKAAEPAPPTEPETPAAQANAPIEPTPQPEPVANPEAPTEVAEPVFMPASKSGGDFGAARFPGQAANPVEQQAPNK